MGDEHTKLIDLPEAIRRYVRMVLIWVTLIASAFAIVLAGSSGILRSWLVSTTIALVTATFCFWGIHILSWAEAGVLRATGRPVPKHGHLWYFLLVALFLPLGIYLGFLAASAICTITGYRFGQPDWSDYRNSILFGLAVCGIMFLFEAIRDAKLARKDVELRLRESENARLQAQVTALTAQMNPHLLFNALNTVASLIKTDPDAAEDMIVRVSDMLRSRLQAGKQELHSLEKEIAICVNYLEIERRRFGDRLVVDTDLSGIENIKEQVPVLCVQPFVENALKYAIAPRAKGGSVRITVRQDDGMTTISIADDGPGLGKSPAASGSQTSIDNCRKRLELLYGDAASVVFTDREHGCEAVLSIPRHAGEGTNR